MIPAKLKTWPEVLTGQGWHTGLTAKGWGPGIARDADGRPRQLTDRPFNHRDRLKSRSCWGLMD